MSNEFRKRPPGEEAGQYLLIRKAAFQKPRKIPIWMIILWNFAGDIAGAGLLPAASVC
jgi:hypothetical protein